MANKAIDLTGNIYGRLTVLSRAESIKGRAVWDCACSCGGAKAVAASELKKGGTKSCGCLANEQRKAAAQSRCHEFSRANLYREHKTWSGMKARCYDPENMAYPFYGGKGVKVCDEWLASFEAFFRDMGKRPAGMTLDRKESTGDYCADNCRWGTLKEQANNRANNHYLTHNGETLTIAQWSERTGLKQRCIWNRINRGWPIHRALSLD